MTGYELSRKWFDFCFENQAKIKPHHTALYFYIIDQNNRLGWVKEFGLPTAMAKMAIGIHSYNTYISTLNDLIDFGFVKLIKKSSNQHSSNIVALSLNNKATSKALDKATTKHDTKQVQSTGQSTSSIIKQENNETTEQNNEQTIHEFDFIWKMYGMKGNKKVSSEKFSRLKSKEKELIEAHIPNYIASVSDKQFLKNFETYLNQRHWETEINSVLVTEKKELTEYVTFEDQAFYRDVKDRATFENMKITFAGGGYVFREIKSEWK